MLIHTALGLAVLAAVVFGILARRARAQAARAKASARAERQKLEADAEAHRTAAQQAQAQEAQAVQHSRAVVAEVRHLAAVRLPAVVEALRRPGVQVPGVADERLLTDPVADACEQVLAMVSHAVLQDRIRTDESAQEIVRSAMGAVRTRSAEAVALVERVQHRITDPDALREMYAADHALVLLHREAQRTAVACGDVPGTAREDTALGTALGMAQSRITQHQRVSVDVQVRREADGKVLGVQAPAAEPVIMVLAELMENAVYCSVGSGLVRAEVHRTATGVLFTVSDSGPGLDTKEKQDFVRRILDSPRLLLRDLGSPPRKGMAAIARLVGRFDGLTLALAPSSARGLRVDLHIHNSLLVPVPERERPTMSGTPLQPIRQRDEPPAIPSGQPASTSSDNGEPSRTALPVRGAAGDFPTRTRKKPDTPAPQQEPLPDRDADAVSASYAALQSGTRRGRKQLDHGNGTSHSTSWES